MMIKCEICGREFKNLAGISCHIKNHKITSEEYYLKYLGIKDKCKTCGGDTKFLSTVKGYQSYCSRKCSANGPDVIEKRENTNIKNFGCKIPYQSEEIRNRGKLTCLKNNGVENPSQNPNIRTKANQTYYEKSGYINASQNPIVKTQKEITNLKNNGCKNPSQNKKIAKKIGEAGKLNFSKLLKKCPELVKIENLIEGPNGEILGHCKNADCKNSAEQGGRFILTVGQIWYRNKGINSTSDGDYIYCCEECKKSCILFGRSANILNNIISPKGNLNQASQQDLSIWRSEVFSRQKIENLRNDNFCEICHKTENLVGHHELPQKLYPEFALDPDNGIVLCSKCHNKYGHMIGTECSTGYLANKSCK
jgi:hypothetical protein